MLDSHGKLRRSLVRSLAATSLVAGSWVAWRLVSESAFSGGMGEAYDPWKRWREADRIKYDLAFSKYKPNSETERVMRSADPRIDFIQAAELAPSTLNSQPWRFQLATDFIDIFGDDRRILPVLDPSRTELLIAIGGALQNLELAASASGYRMENGAVQAGLPEAITRFRLVERGQKDSSPLYESIPRCHDNCGIYDGPRELSTGLNSELQSLRMSDKTHILLLPPQEIEGAAEAITNTVRQITADPGSLDEIYRWFRQTRESIYLSRDGINVDAFSLPVIEKICLKIGPNMNPEEFGYFLVKHTQRVCSKEHMVGIIALEENGTALDYVSVGKLWQRIRLWAQTKGLAVQSLNQSTFGALDRTLRTGTGETNLTLYGFLQQFARYPVICWRMGQPRWETLPGPRRSIAETIEI